DIDLAALERCSELRNLIAELPGDKFVFTNGSAQHAANVCAKLGLDDLFNGVFDIVAADFKPKPHRVTYERFVETHNVDAAKAAMFEDIAHNLEAPYALGMKTVLIASDAVWIEDEPQHKRPASPEDDHSHVHHVTDDLKSFLKRLETAA
ncbi:MAG: HAD-IA family hydrolase, partial [Pseudomonadota bacterium]